MERAKAQLLELTRCGLWGSEPCADLFEGGVEWSQIIKLAKEQTLLGIASVAIERLPATLRPARVEALKIHQMVTLNRQYRSHHVVVLGKLMEMMKGLGVDRPVLLKGLGVGLNYPDPSLRQCGDIDLYVGDRYYFEVWDYICQEFGIKRDENHSDQHFDFDFMNTHIEIHRYATTPSSVAFRRDEFMAWCTEQLEGEELREIEIDGVKFFVPPYNFDYIYIFYHTWRHFLTGGIGLRQLCDWGLYVTAHSDKVDREAITALISRFRLSRAMSLFASIEVHSLGVDARHFEGVLSTSNSNAMRALDRIWQGGNFGFYREERQAKPKNILERKWHSLRAMISDMLFMFSIDPIYAAKFYPPLFFNSVSIAIQHRKELNKKL